MDHGQGRSCETLASVTLPPLPVSGGGAQPRLLAPGAAVRHQPPTPPPRPSNTFYPPVARSASSGTPQRLQRGINSTQISPSIPSSTGTAGQLSTQQGAPLQQQNNNLFSSLVNAIQPPTALSRTSGGISESMSGDSPSESTQNITLFTPRTHRLQNVYVETPIKNNSENHPLSAVLNTPLNSIKRLSSGIGGGLHRPHHLPHNLASSVPLNSNNKSLPTVITQPLSGSGGGSHGICKPAANTAISSNLSSPTSSSDSIICGECGKCRCASCRSARKLPSTWMCDNKCECSLESCVDTLSCMCIVKAGLYHCGEFVSRGEADTHEQEWVDHPCSCSSNNWLARWSCLCVCSLFLPCLWCYPLLKGTSLLVERAYQAATRHGCTCSDENSTSTALRRNIGLNLSNSSSNNSASHDLSTASSTSPLAAAEDKRLLS